MNEPPIQVFSHFHKPFPFNFHSSWVKATYSGGTGPYEWHSPTDDDYINVTSRNFLNKYRHYYSSIEEWEFLRAIGQQVTDYYTTHLDTSSEYLGCASYRRFLWIDPNDMNERKNLPATVESSNLITSDEQMNKALDLLQNCDLIITRERTISTSVEIQYLTYELPEYWFLFKEGITRVNPSYKNEMNWFIESNRCHYEAVYIMKKHLFRQMMIEFFLILEHVWKNCSEVYPDKTKKHYDCSEPYPWRYPGFLHERYVPFFLHANKLSKVEVPLAFLS